MKKILALLLVVLLSVTVFAACGEKKPEVPAEEPAVETPAEEPAAETPAEEPAEEPADTESALKGDDSGIRTGVGVVTTMNSSADASEDADGLGQVDSVVAAVLIDNDGKIISVRLDTAQSKINFGTDGKLITPMDNVFQTKHELGDAYNMRPASPIGKEWNEQADAFVAYVIGKDLSEIKGIALTAETAPDVADLEASVTMKVGGYIEAITKALESAQNLGAAEGDTLGLGVVTTMAQSKDADADTDGKAQAYTTYMAVTLNAENQVTSTVIDASQGNVTFDVEGKITSDKEAGQASKRELGEGYAMRGASPIGKEWFEQGTAFAQYITGKTLTDITGMALTEEDNAPDVEDLKASVTITVTDMIGALEKAVANAAVAVPAPAAAVTEEVVTDEAQEVDPNAPALGAAGAAGEVEEEVAVAA